MAASKNAHPHQISVNRLYYTSRVLGGVMLLSLATAAFFSVRFGYADWEFQMQTADGVGKAAAMVPQNTAYLTQSALEGEYSGEDASPIWKRIAELSPRSSAPLLQQAFSAEQRGDRADAERLLLRAFDVDRQFETRWALANFYLRQQRLPEFWQWTRSALEIYVGDRKLVYDLAWKVSADANEILTKAIPNDGPSFAAYLSYLLSTGQIEAVFPAEQRLLQVGKPDEYRDLLRWSCDLLANSGRGGEAAVVWRDLGYPAPMGVSNPNFEDGFGGIGFDWKYEVSTGVTHAHLDTGGHRIRLSGQQAESVELLRQMVGGLASGKQYRLEWQIDARGLDTKGLRWKFDGVKDTGAVALRDGRSDGSWDFQAPGEFVNLSLQYARQSGEVRAQGSLDLLSVRIVPAGR